MRIFIAVTFDDTMRKNLIGIQKALQEQARKGSFTFPDNLHLTIKFIGEMKFDRLEEIKESMRKICAPTAPFSISLSHPGSFKRRGEHLYWVGLDKGARVIKKLAGTTDTILNERMGFEKEKRPYQAHITIARRVIMEDKFKFDSQNIPDYKQPVNSLVLMESSHITGKLTYTPLYTCDFEG